MTSLIVVGVVAIITIIGILSRYRKCKSDELLVVYGKTGSHKEKVSERDAKGNLVDREVEIKTAKVYHGDSNTAGQFMANMAKNLAPSLEIARNLPIADSLKQIITGKKPEESPANGDKFPPVK